MRIFNGSTEKGGKKSFVAESDAYAADFAKKKQEPGALFLTALVSAVVWLVSVLNGVQETHIAWILMALFAIYFVLMLNISLSGTI